MTDLVDSPTGSRRRAAGRSSTRRMVMLGIGIATVALAGFGLLLLSRGAAAPEAAPARPEAPRAVVALGRIDPENRIVRIAAPAAFEPATLLEVRVTEGDHVPRGAVIATLDTLPKLDAKRVEAWASVATRRALHERQQATTRFDDVELIAAVQRLEAERDRMRWDVERGEQLRAGGVVTESWIVERRLKLRSAETAIAEMRARLARVRSGGVASVDLAVTAAELAAAEAAARTAEIEYERAFVRAPIDGEIIRLGARAGERVPTDEGVATIAAAGPMAIRAEVFESDVPRLRIGQAATAAGPALAKPIAGSVIRIGSEVARQSIIREDPSADTDARVVTVDIRLDEASSAAVRGLNNLRVRVRFEE